MHSAFVVNCQMSIVVCLSGLSLLLSVLLNSNSFTAVTKTNVQFAVNKMHASVDVRILI